MISSASGATLSVDLLHDIFSFLSFDQEGRQALFQCCRVSRTFCANAQPHVFFNVDLSRRGKQRDDVVLFHRALSLNACLATHVRYFQFQASFMSTPEFVDVLSALLQLQVLSISGMHKTWDQLPSEITSALLLKVFPRLSALHIAKFYSFSFPDVLNSLQNLQEFSLDYIAGLEYGDSENDEECIRLRHLRSITFDGYEDSDVLPTFSLRSVLMESQCPLETLILKDSTGRDGNILTFFHEYCLAGLGNNLRTLYLGAEFFRTVQSRDPDSEPKATSNFLDFGTIPRLEHLYIEAPASNSSVSPSRSVWETSSRFFFRLAEMLGFGARALTHSSTLCSLTFIDVQMANPRENTEPCPNAWTAFDDVLMDQNSLPLLERVSFTKRFKQLDVLKTWLPRVVNGGILHLGVDAGSVSLWF
ncbi:hypothetical protein DL96DRAFT_1580942 [Flagelloscypha sp. PMI_526]|nr:hypothetical protein DL96DRAFT_1580942 [Flagelloscypha sp. PMI_526]